MRELSKEFEDVRVLRYVIDMMGWINSNTELTTKEIKKLFEDDIENIKQLFEPYPETIFHDDPAKWAEMYMIRWGLKAEQDLEFIDNDALRKHFLSLREQCRQDMDAHKDILTEPMGHEII